MKKREPRNRWFDFIWWWGALLIFLWNAPTIPQMLAAGATGAAIFDGLMLIVLAMLIADNKEDCFKPTSKEANHE